MRFLGRDIDTHMHPSGFLQHLCQPKGEIQLMGKIYHSHSKTMLKIANFFEVPYPTKLGRETSTLS